MIAKNADRMGELDDFDELHAWTREKMRRYLRAEDVVLDFGCGGGVAACAIAGDVAAVQGIDTSAGMVALARRRAEERAIHNVEFIRATLFDERLEAGSFDVVLALGVLHFFDEPALAVRRVHELLRPGGRFVSNTACMGERGRSVVSLVVRLLVSAGVLPRMRFLTVAELESTLSGEGFRIAESDTFYENSQPLRFIAAQKE
jgi:2-polyprenyl-3-methyl-5-hydroxy-6-metoxy-1,4-benzoquinol methylase